MPLFYFKENYMKSVMTPQQLFNRVSKPDVKRSTFDRSHGYKTTFDAGKLIPFYIDEALPGDTFNMKTAVFGRLATPLKPIMDNISIDVHYFSVPIRLVWENFQKFMGEQDNPGDSTDFLMPQLTVPVGGYTEQSVFDYAGIPTKIESLEVRADFFRAMNLIWNEWYRDENLQDSLDVDVTNGPDTYTKYPLLDRGKRKDYFTSALPFAQKGDPVTVPIGGFAPVISTGDEPWFNNGLTNRQMSLSSGNFNVLWDSSAPTTTGTLVHGKYDDVTATGLTADLSQATSQTINALREAASVQKLLERDARGGTRYTEIIYAHFGVQSLDARLQRPEFLGGFSTNVNVNPIAQTSNTSGGSTPQGNLAAMGTFSANKSGFIKSFTEHEIVIGFLSARADLNYQQGLNKMWSRQTRYDHYFPEFAHLGEQAIFNREIYAQGTSADEEVFGYQERYAEYRYKPSMVTGLFRSNAATSLDIWHLSQDFASLPVLNDEFIQEDPPIDRIIAVPSEPQFIVDMYMDLKCTRPMPVYSIPGLETF